MIFHVSDRLRLRLTEVHSVVRDMDPRVRRVVDFTNLCVQHGLARMQAAADSSPSLISHGRTVDGGRRALQVDPAHMTHAEVLSRRMMPAPANTQPGSGYRVCTVSKYTVLRWALDIGLEMFERALTQH